MDWRWYCMCPEPRHMLHVVGLVPGWQQEPSHAGHTTAVSTVMSFSTPNTASLREMRTLISASWPCRVRDCGPRWPPAPAPWKNVSKMSEKPNPEPGKPPPKPVSVPFSLPVAS